jgi:hypothetical protein
MTLETIAPLSDDHSGNPSGNRQLCSCAAMNIERTG